MSFAASGSQIIFADTDGVFAAGLSSPADVGVPPLGTVVVGPEFAVVGLPELPPHAARSDAQATDAMATVRRFTNRIVPTGPLSHRSGTAAHAQAAIAFAGCAGPSFSHLPLASRARSSWP
jgi:hypothetical protein